MQCKSDRDSKAAAQVEVESVVPHKCPQRWNSYTGAPGRSGCNKLAEPRFHGGTPDCDGERSCIDCATQNYSIFEADFSGDSGHQMVQIGPLVIIDCSCGRQPTNQVELGPEVLPQAAEQQLTDEESLLRNMAESALALKDFDSFLLFKGNLNRSLRQGWSRIEKPCSAF